MCVNVDTQSVSPQHAGKVSFQVFVDDVTGKSLKINVTYGTDMYSLRFQV